MIVSYEETSGFSPVSNEELVSVNGGFGITGVLITLGTVLLAGCTMPTNSEIQDGRSPTGKRA
jgi:lactobin A/cerein 7B family class IIb bacteriocin